MSRSEKAAEAQALRSEGFYYREIAERMGISTAYAQELVTDPEGSGVRARKDSYRGECESCGARTDGSNGRTGAPDVCSSCHAERNAERNARLIELWEAGASTEAIADELGMTGTAVLSWVDNERDHKGAEISRRRRPNLSSDDQLREAVEAGLSDQEIADRLGYKSAASARFAIYYRLNGGREKRAAA